MPTGFCATSLSKKAHVYVVLHSGELGDARRLIDGCARLIACGSRPQSLVRADERSGLSGAVVAASMQTVPECASVLHAFDKRVGHP